MHKAEIEEGLKNLSPEIPWAHYFEFSPGFFSVSKDNEQFYKKAIGLHRIGKVLLDVAQTQVRGHTLRGKRVLDLACGEGGHAVQFAQCGAEVIGVEGRKLYVERARFAAAAMCQSRVDIIQGDVRQLSAELGTFDIVLFSGILHHLGIMDFDNMIKELSRLTNDLLLIYTHVSSELAIKNHRLQGPVKTLKGYEGFLFREHVDGATAEQKERQVRASLDNTFSFWAREEALIDALRSAGFSIVLKVMSPHAFGWENASYRPFFVAKKADAQK